jgi:glycosyltransferase involved in cell wall biosynthesis
MTVPMSAHVTRSWCDPAESSMAGGAALPNLCEKVLVFAAADREALPRFKPTLDVLATCARELVVVTRASGRLLEIEARGVRTVDFDDDWPSGNTADKAVSVWRLARIIEAEQPDVVHLVGSRSILMGGLAVRLQPAPRVMLHVTGRGPLGLATGRLSRIARRAGLRLVASMLRDPASYLLVENPSDLALLRAAGADPGARFAILGGPGIDPQEFQALSPPANAVPVAACVGGMTRGNGIDVLFKACDRVAARGMPLALHLYGQRDATDPDAIDGPDLDAAVARCGGGWHGPVADAHEVWRRADICVLPGRHGGGMPRALLEAAACARPLLVTDVPGARDFVRNGVEGLVVPADNPAALADALLHLAREPDLRERMGEAARLRLLHGYTDTHLREALRAAYQSLLGRKGAR